MNRHPGEVTTVPITVKTSDGAQFIVPLAPRAFAHLDDAELVMTATRIVASRDGVFFELSEGRAPINYDPATEPESWSHAWDRCGLPSYVEGGQSVLAACLKIERWLLRRDRRNGQRGVGADHAHMDLLITEMACDIDRASQSGVRLTQRDAAKAVVLRKKSGVSADALRKAFNRAKAEASGDKSFRVPG